jgi:hypothetical protein
MNDEKLLSEEAFKEINQSILKELKTSFEDAKTILFNRIDDWYLDHFDNCSEQLKRRLIREIQQAFKENPFSIEHRALLDILWQENKESLLETWLDHHIETAFNKLIHDYTHLNMPFSWKWKEFVAKYIVDNVEFFLKDSLSENQLLHEIHDLKAEKCRLERLVDLLEEEDSEEDE